MCVRDTSEHRQYNGSGTFKNKNAGKNKQNDFIDIRISFEQNRMEQLSLSVH